MLWLKPKEPTPQPEGLDKHVFPFSSLNLVAEYGPGKVCDVVVTLPVRAVGSETPLSG